MYTTHGMSFSPEYRAWRHMGDRCTNTNNKDFKHYGARGISICERWNNFLNFYDDVGPRPSGKHSIDRINNDGNYEPSNCRWATRSEQQRNQRIRKTNKSGVAGVFFRRNRWHAIIGINGIKRSLYYGPCFQHAVEARINAESKYWKSDG